MAKRKKRMHFWAFMLVLLSGMNVNYTILLGEFWILGKITTNLIYFTRVGVVIYFLFFLAKRFLNRVHLKYFFYFISIFFVNTLAELNEIGEAGEWFHRTLSMGYLLIYYSTVIKFAENYREELLNAMYFISAFLLLDSFVLYCLHPEIATYCEGEGIYTLQGVAGNRNHIIEYWILETIGLFGSEKLYANKKCQGFWIFTMFIQSLTKSGTGIVVMAVTVFMIFIYCKRRNLFKFVLFINYIIICWVYIVMVFNQKLIFEYFIVNVLHKSPTLTGRLLLWETTVEEIMRFPILGYGYDNALEYGAIDNSVLYLLMAGGFLGTIIWLFMLVSSHSSVILKKSISRTEAALSIGILAYMVRSITEAVVSYPHIVFWCSLILLDMEKYTRRVEMRHNFMKKIKSINGTVRK